MAQIENTTTTGATPSQIVTIQPEDGATEIEMHFTADDPSSGDCAAGDCKLVIKKQSAMAPVVKSISTDAWHSDFGALALTALVSGNDVIVSVPGVAGVNLDWEVSIGV